MSDRTIAIQEANQRLAARLGIEYDPIVHRPADAAAGTYTLPAPPPPERMTEAVGSTHGDADMDGIASARGRTSGWRLLGERVTQKRTDLTLMDQDQMLRLALKLWDTNPLAQRLVKRLVNYVMGEGVTITAKHETDGTRKKIQEVLDRTWKDHRNRLDRKLARWALGFEGYGELCLNTTVNPANGLVRFANVSPFQILGVYTEQEDVEQIDMVAVGRDNTTTPRLLKAIRVDEDGSIQRWLEAYEAADSEWQQTYLLVINDRAARAKSMAEAQAGGRIAELRILEAATATDTRPVVERDALIDRRLQELSTTDPDRTDVHLIGRGGVIQGEFGDKATAKKDLPRRRGKAFYWGANTLPGMVRGRSILLAIADMIDAYDRLIWLGLERRALINAFVWDVKLIGANQKVIDEWWEKNPAPEPGSIRVHNEREEWTAVNPDLKANDESQAGDQIVSYIALGPGFPRHWVGGQDDPNRASAVEMSTPTMKDMTAAQRELRAIVEDIGAFIIDCAVLAGVLPADTPSDCFEIGMPDLSVADTVKAASTFQAAMTAFLALQAANIIDVEEVQAAYAILAVSLGHEPDLESLRKRLEDARAEQEASAGGLYGPNGVPIPPALAAKLPPDKAVGLFGPPAAQNGVGGPGGGLGGLQRPTGPLGQDRKAGSGDAQGAGAARISDRQRILALAKELAGAQS